MAEQALDCKSKDRGWALFLPSPEVNSHIELQIQRSSFNSAGASPAFLLTAGEVDWSQLSKAFSC